MFTTQSLPEPTIVERNRSLRADFPLFTDPDDHPDYPGRKHFATLSVHHHLNRKCYAASVQRETEEDQGQFTVRSFMAFAGVRIGVEPTPRYNAKRQREFLDRMLAELPQLIETDEKVAAIFDPEAEL